MERDTLAEVTRLTEAGEIYEAYRLIRGVREKLPHDPEVRRLLERISFPISVVTKPAGAEVHVKGYSTPDAPWELLGETPLVLVRIPYALMRWRIQKEGYEAFEGAPLGVRPLLALGSGFALDPAGSRPAGMVRVPGGPYTRLFFPPVELEDYWLDRHEVTNQEFKRFVDAGGYEREELWTEPFVEEGRELPRDEAMARLRDRTGRPGPATWEFGSYDEGRDDFPVGGVSWYEAAAYCRFADKSLPTLYHWSAAAAQDQLSDIVRFSNFGSDGPVPVGSLPGLGDFGTYDMAGNVKEWCWNASGAGRYILGGSWAEPTYLFTAADSRRPFARDPSHGFRCARLGGPVDDALVRPVSPSWHVIEEDPVADDVFEAYRRLYAYDRTDLAAETHAVDESSPHWVKESVSFRAAYGGERVIAHLFLPRNAAPPYQPVIWFPGDDAFFLPAGEALASPYLFDFIPRSGRALVYPVYKGMYERHVPFFFEPNEWRDMVVMWSKDLSRTVDYLEERPDMDTDRLGYYGFSGGAQYGPIFTAIDPRFRASVLLAGGLLTGVPPEMAGVNFAPRSRVPTLMINGRNDFIFPYEVMQEPFFRLLGPPEEDKRHARLEGGHIPPDRIAIIEEVVGWFDRHLGPVKR
jgi:hypothetical protein